MAFAPRLVNPTPWDVELNYEKGVVISVPAFGSVDLRMDQYNDYLPDKPGSEAVYEVLEFEGVFLFDTDRPYENQAVEALKKMITRRKALLDGKVKTHSDRAARQGLQFTPEAAKNLHDQLGATLLEDQVATLKRFVEKYEKVVTKETAKRRSTLDPERTVFATNPPREFPSKVAREFFLAENPEVAEKEAELRAGMKKAEDESNS